jgi:pimeloyl-ACP methyl ester carboxylesterase
VSAAVTERVDEGYVGHAGSRTWYRSVGETRDGGCLPLLTVHDGPGATHVSLRPLEALAESGRRVVFYDQLGCGRSDRPGWPLAWSVLLFLDELARIRQALGLARLHLLGHAWGGLLAMEHVLGGSAGVGSLALASSPAPAAREGEATIRDRVVTTAVRDWDVTERLPGLRLPVLITSGRHDETTPLVARTAYRSIAGARWVVCGPDAHPPRLGGAGEYLATLRQFLADVEG